MQANNYMIATFLSDNLLKLYILSNYIINSALQIIYN